MDLDDGRLTIAVPSSRLDDVGGHGYDVGTRRLSSSTLLYSQTRMIPSGWLILRWMSVGKRPSMAGALRSANVCQLLQALQFLVVAVAGWINQQ